ncbi:MAG: hypothetical protein ABIK07_24250 [Planctomycetota bacterium]
MQNLFNVKNTLRINCIIIMIIGLSSPCVGGVVGGYNYDWVGSIVGVYLGLFLSLCVMQMLVVKKRIDRVGEISTPSKVPELSAGAEVAIRRFLKGWSVTLATGAIAFVATFGTGMWFSIKSVAYEAVNKRIQEEYLDGVIPNLVKDPKFNANVLAAALTKIEEDGKLSVKTLNVKDTLTIGDEGIVLKSTDKGPNSIRLSGDTGDDGATYLTLSTHSHTSQIECKSGHQLVKIQASDKKLNEFLTERDNNSSDARIDLFSISNNKDLQWDKKSVVKN